MIAIIDCGLGNLGSISNMLNKIGVPSQVVRRSMELNRYSKFILPGVGSFDFGMNCLETGGFKTSLEQEILGNKKPVLGICLGMQLLCSGSEEGVVPGLGWINCRFRKFRFPPESNLKVPHMGWNTVRPTKDNILILNTHCNQERFYFVHTYHGICENQEDIIAVTNHGCEVLAAFQRQNIFGVQFHPEKSHSFGMKLLKRFSEV